MAKLLLSLLVAILVAEGSAFRGRWRNRDPEPEEEMVREPISMPDILDKIPDGIKDSVADVALSGDELDAQVAACQGDSGDLDPASQGKVDKVIQFMQGRRITKLLIKVIRRQLKDPESGIRKLLGAAAADPHDTDDTNEEAPGGAVNGPLVKLLIKIMGETKTVVGYLWRFGFFAKVMGKSKIASENYEGGIPACAITNAVMEFQRFNQLPITGKLTKETRALMAKDRCGNKDVECETEECILEDAAAEEELGEEEQDGLLRRRRRYVVRTVKNGKLKLWKSVQGSSPRRTVLNYYFGSGYDVHTTDKVVKAGHDQAFADFSLAKEHVAKGFGQWSKYSNIEFREVSSKRDANIQIEFGAGSHGEKNSGAWFDGPLGVLAHMFYPRNGKVHFDSSENWTSSEKGPGINLMSISAHEMGHGLGLKHSGVPGAAMGPNYSGYRKQILERDDIRAIRFLYGQGEGLVKDLDGNTIEP